MWHGQECKELGITDMEGAKVRTGSAAVGIFLGQRDVNERILPGNEIQRDTVLKLLQSSIQTMQFACVS